MHRKQLVPVLLSLLVIVSSGCLGLGGDNTEEPTSAEAQELVEQATQSMQDVDTYTMEMSVEMSTNGQTLSLDTDSVINRTDKRAQVELSVNGMGQAQTITSYIINESVYVQQDGTWQSQQLSDGQSWDSRDHLQQSRKLFEESSVRVVGNDTVDGTPVRVLEIDADQEAMLDLISQQRDSISADVSPTDVTLRQYVSTETNLTRKIEMDMQMGPSGQSASASVMIRFSDFGTDTDIAVPDGATS